MLLMFERGIRGGITQSVHRWAKANNPYMGSEFNPDEKTNYLQYLNANNLYGWAMSRPLSTGKLKWVEVKPNEIRKLVKCKGKGYLLEADVKYSKELHDSHNDLPFMCERMKINGVENLIPNLFDKRKYVIHIRALDQALHDGLILEHIHQAIEFDQSAWMKEHKDFNTQLRTQARNDFEKDFYKLMNNAVFGKTMKSVRKHRNIKLVTSEESYFRTVMKPNFKSGVRFGENLMECEMGNIKVVMKKPVYLGQAILDLSMYEFHYDYMKPKFKDLKLCYMNTDPLIYNIKTEDFYADIANDIPVRFDTSGYCPNQPLPIGLNKKVIRSMKDELGGAIMTEFVALRPKLYSYKKLDGAEDTAGQGEVKKCKGIKKCTIKKTLTFDDNKDCLFNDSTEYRSQLMFRSMKHDIFTLEVNKVALSRDNDKRISKEDGISTLA